VRLDQVASGIVNTNHGFAPREKKMSRGNSGGFTVRIALAKPNCKGKTKPTHDLAKLGAVILHEWVIARLLFSTEFTIL
jgi:hypothetical protein